MRNNIYIDLYPNGVDGTCVFLINPKDDNQYTPPSPPLVCIETNPGPRSSKRKGSKSSSNKNLLDTLKKIQANTSTQIQQVIPDTVSFPILKPVRPYSVILSYTTSYVNSNSVPTFFSRNLIGNDFADFASYAAVFDKYRILEVQFSFIPNLSGVTVVGSGITHTVIDYDDSTALSTLSECYEYSTLYSCPTNSTFKRTFIPRASNAMMSSALPTTFGEAKAGQWIDCASPTCAHYGLKGAITPTNPIFALDVVVRAHLQFSNQH